MKKFQKIAQFRVLVPSGNAAFQQYGDNQGKQMGLADA